MKISLLTLCLGLSMMLQGQSFRWDEDVQEIDPPTTAAVQYSGIAKVYPDYYDGNPTALGEIFYQEQMTAAHKKLPLGTIVKVIRLDNGSSTTVRINDRGAYCDGCVVDLSQAAARQLNISNGSETKVKLEVMGASSTTPDAYGTTAGIGAQADLSARSVTPIPQQIYAASPPPPNVYNEPQEATLVARTPFSDKTAVLPTTPSNQVTGSAPPKVQAKAVMTNDVGATNANIIDVPISPFSVQLGAYGKYSNAERHVVRLQQQGFNNVFLLLEPGPGNTALHRVIIAPFLTYEAAAEYVADLAYHHQIKGLVMQAKLIEVE